MNNPLVYTLVTRFKNKILSIFKKPSSLILTIIIVLLLGSTIFTSQDYDITYLRNINELYAGAFALFAFVFILTSFSGISKGASMFTMADVNFMFPSPLSPIKILIYGLVQQMGTSLLLGFFILYQYALIHTTYGVNFSFLIVALVFYALMGFCGQLTAMVIYSLTSSSDKKRNAVKYSLTAFFILSFGGMFIKALSMGQNTLLENAVEVLSSPFAGYFPLFGWAKSILEGIYGICSKERLIICSALIIIYIVSMVVVIKVKQSDYYEDVLKVTESNHNIINAKKEGKITEAVPQNVKVGKIGLGGGYGSNVFFYKHRVESRRAKIFIFDTVTLVYSAIIIGFSFFVKNEGLYPVILFSTYMQMFSVALGRWTKEFYLPYIYLIPEPPFKKLINCLKETVLKTVIEAFFVMIIIGSIMELTPIEIIALIIMRISFGILFTCGNIFCERFFGKISIKTISIIVNFLMLMLFSVPFIIVFFFANEFFFFYVDAAGLFAGSVMNIIVSGIVLFASRNVLQYAELNNN